MPVWPSEEWMAVYRDRINGSSEYREAAHDWEGAVMYHFQAEPDKHLGEDVYGLFDLWHGECRDARQVTSEEASKAEFVISAPYSVWKQVMKKEMEPIRALMQGRLKMKGDLTKAVRYTKASLLLQDIAANVPDTEFLDELPRERLEQLRDEGQPIAL